MCGIAGFQGRFAPEILHLFNHTLSHRGPDDSGEWYSARALVGLAHRRLSIIDVSALGHQPMENRPRTAVIVFNGEIYNFRELRADLERSGHSFRGHSDTEVLLALYEVKGEGMLPLLNGIFAFAIWDDAARSLLLACDAMSVKPLYFAQTAEGFLFASELKALMRTATIPATIDVASLFRTLGYLWSPGGATPIRGVRRLGPGEALRVKDCRIVRQWTWATSTWLGEPINVGRGRSGTACRNRCGPPSIVRWWPTCRLAHSCPVASIRVRWSPWPSKNRRRLIASRSTREACAIAGWRMTCRMHDRLRATSV